jgi:Domain of unknown function (DUF4279)
MTANGQRVAVRPYSTPYNDADATCERTCAVLRIYSGEMAPAEVDEFLGVRSTSHVTKGETRTNSIGRTRVGKLNAWFLSSEGRVQSLDLRRHLDWLLSIIKPAEERIAALQDKSDVTMYVECIWWAKDGGGGPTLWPVQLRALADLNLECRFAFADYSDDDG